MSWRRAEDYVVLIPAEVAREIYKDGTTTMAMATYSIKKISQGTSNVADCGAKHGESS